jgi:putative chitinase
MSVDPRKPLADALRPHLKQGWTPSLLAEFDRQLDALGVPRAPVEIVVTAPRPTEAMSFAQRQIDGALLDLAFPANNPVGLAPWIAPTQEACVRWGIDTIREVASFLANINVESAGLTRLTESLNYSTEALIAKFGRHRISIEDARRYGRNAAHPADQEALANILYGGEWGAKNLGNTQPGDGWLFRGYGPKQLTGRGNQGRFATAMGMQLADMPAYLRTPEGGMMGAGWFWKSHGLDAAAATPGVADDRKLINGGAFGLGEVEAVFDLLIDELLRREKAA